MRYSDDLIQGNKVYIKKEDERTIEEVSLEGAVYVSEKEKSPGQ